MSSLMSMAPQKAVLAENGQVVEAKDVKVNTILAVKAGEVIPIDGVVVEGNSEVDEKSLTGESFPVAKQTDSVVWAGTINLTGYISVKTTTLSDDTAVAKMAKLVEEAQSSKSKTQRLIDSCAKYYTPTVVVVAIGVAVVPVAMRVHNIRHWLHLALVFLVSTCPCALVLSTPVATYCALTKAAAFGLLVKGGDYLEALAKIKVIAFDKTGTITKGEFSVTEFRGCHNVSEETLLYWVSSIESKSSHPMAGALVEYSRSNGVEPRPDEVKEFENFPGEGIYGEIDGKTIYIGNKKIAARVKCSSVPAMEGTTIGYVFLESTPVGVFSLSDTCRIGVAKAIRELKHLGLKTAMLTGDSNAAAMYIQHQLGQAIEMVHAELLPEEKVAFIKELKTKFGPTVMVGDGMNDAPALATADIGISMGIAGAAVSIEAGHVTLMSNDVRKIPLAIRLSRETRRRIIENVIVSIVVKGAILALALAGHPFVWAAVVADVGTCLLVIFNSMRLRGGTPRAHGAHEKNNKCCGEKGKQGKCRHGCGPCERESTAAAEHGCHALDERKCCSDSTGKKPYSVDAFRDVETGLEDRTDKKENKCCGEKGKQGKSRHGCGPCEQDSTAAAERECHALNERKCCSDSAGKKPYSVDAFRDVETGLEDRTDKKENKCCGEKGKQGKSRHSTAAAKRGCRAQDAHTCCSDSAGKKPKSSDAFRDVETGLVEWTEGHGHCSATTQEWELGVYAHERSCCSSVSAAKKKKLLETGPEETTEGLGHCSATTHERELGGHAHKPSCCSSDSAAAKKKLLETGPEETTVGHGHCSADREACVDHGNGSSKEIAHVHDRPSPTPCSLPNRKCCGGGCHERSITILGDIERSVSSHV